MKVIAIQVLSAVILLVLGVGSGELQVQPEKENVVGSGLVGEWVPDESASQRLGTTARGTLVIEDDSTVLKRIPPKLATILAEHRIYLAGRMSQRVGDKAREDYVFALIEVHGNPYLMQFWSRGGVEVDDATSSIVMLARAADAKNDMLFLGGDFNNGPFRAWKRAVK